MSEYIIEPSKTQGKALVYPDEYGVDDDDKLLLTPEEIHAEFGQHEVMLLFEDGWQIHEGHDPESGGPAIVIGSHHYDLSLIFPYETYEYEQRKYKDGTGPIRESVRLTDDAYVLADGTRLFSYDDYDGGGGFRKRARDKMENVHSRR